MGAPAETGQLGRRSGRSELLRQAGEEAAPGTELRGEDADAGAVADLIDLVEEIDHVETGDERTEAGRRGANS